MNASIFNRTVGLWLLVGAFTGLISACSPYRIQSNGLKYAKLGDEMPQRGKTKWALVEQTDTTYSENGFTWKASRLGFEEGIIWVEEGFGQSGIIGRVRVECPTFTLGKDIRTGLKASELLQRYDGWVMRPFAEYQLVEATNPRFPRLYFLFSAPGMNFNEDLPELLTPEEIPNGSKLEKIVVM